MKRITTKKDKPIFFGPLKKAPKEKPFLVWDIETKPKYSGEPINTEWLGGGLYDGYSEPQIFTDEAEFFAALLSPVYADHWLYAHNASGFDFHYLLRFFSKRKLPWTAYRTGQRLFVGACGREFFDSAAILRGSLASIGEALGLKVKKWDIDEHFYEQIEKRPWREYLCDDLRSLHEAIAVTRDAIGKLGAALRPTLASTAMCLFRRQYLDCEIRCLPPTDPTPEIWRQAYLGGRTEVFKNKMSTGCSWDINSSYPASMVDPAGMPCDYLGSFNVRELPQNPAICYAVVTIPKEEMHPPLPVIGNDGRLYFPTGTRSGWYCSTELDYCIKKYGSDAVKINGAHLFEPRNIFDAYVKDLYNIKGKKGVVGYNAKLCLNSLYGKFGMQREREKIVAGEDWHDWPWSDPSAMKKFEAKKEIPHKKVISEEDQIYAIPDYANWATYIMPQIAATVTARSRILLQGFLDQAGEAACYCDTDSIYAEKPETFFKTTKDLGGLKLEQKWEHVTFAAPKVYHGLTANGEAKGKAKGVCYKDASEVLRFMNGEAVKVKRILGIFETRRRTHKADPVSEWASKKAISFAHRRNPNGQAFSITNLKDLGIIL
jgi:hypothetical protein